MGSCLILGNNSLRNKETLLGRGTQAENSRITESRRTALHMTPASCFLVIGLVSGVPLANHSDSGAFLMTCALLRQDGFQWGGLWEVGRTYGLVFPFCFWHFLYGSDGKESACNAGSLGLISELGTRPGEGNSYPLQYSGLENSLDRGAWWVTVYGVVKSWTWLSDFHFHFSYHSGRWQLVNSAFFTRTSCCKIDNSCKWQLKAGPGWVV